MATESATNPATGHPFPREADDAQSARPSTASNSPEGLLDRVVQGAHDTVDRLAERALPAVQSLQSTGSRVSEMHDEWLNSCRQHVRERPLTSILAALAAGWLLGRLMQGR